MSYTLGNLLLDCFDELGQLQVSTATGGTTTTIVDSKQVGEHGADDWKNGVAFIVRDAAGASAAPEGEFQRISGYTDSTGTFTVDTAFSAAPASGDTFGWTGPRWGKSQMIRSINRALQSLGDLDFVDTTTLDSVASQTEYSWAVDWKRGKPKRIDIQTITNDANDNRWETVWDYDAIPAAGGSTGLIVFDRQPIASRDIRVWYESTHPKVNDYDDVIDERIHPELAKWACVVAALSWMNRRTQGAEQSIVSDLNDSRGMLEMVMRDHKVWRSKKKNNIFIVPQNVTKDRFTYPQTT